MDFSNQKLGKYEVKTPHRSGSTSTIYLAYDPDLNRQVAVKHIQIGSFCLM